LDGAKNAILAEAFPAVAITAVGAPGTVFGTAGVTAVDATEATELPTALVATTLKVYAVPFVKPVTFIGDVVPVPIKLPGLDVTVYPVTTLPPLLVGATNATLAEALPAVATTAVGGPGTVFGTAGVTELDATEATELPTAFVATTVKV
jgi:hypothetical protein